MKGDDFVKIITSRAFTALVYTGCIILLAQVGMEVYGKFKGYELQKPKD